MVKYDRDTETRSPDIVIVKKERNCIIIDTSVSVEKNQDLKREIKKVWSIRSAKVVPVIVGVLGATTET